MEPDVNKTAFLSIGNEVHVSSFKQGGTCIKGGWPGWKYVANSSENGRKATVFLAYLSWSRTKLTSFRLGHLPFIHVPHFRGGVQSFYSPPSR